MASGKDEKKPLPASVIAQYTLVVVAIIAAALFFWQIRDALLIALGGVIVAVIISGLARGLRQILPISRGWSLAGAGLEIILVIGLFILIFGPQISGQFEELTQKLPERISEVQQSIQEWPMGERLVDGMGEEQNENEQQQDQNENSEGDEENGAGGQDEQQDEEGEAEENEETEDDEENEEMGGAGGMIFQAGAAIVDMLATLALVIFVGVFFAINPDLYKNGILLLFTKQRTGRVEEALDASGNALWHWLMGQLVSMAFVGITVAIGLSIVGVPLALILGLIAGLFDFVPYLGPLAALVPGLLLAMAEGPDVALWAGLVYLIAQQLEGYVVTPLIQRRKVSMPPSLTILAVVSFGLVFGVPGIVLATPLAVVTMVLVGMLYVEDVLGKDIAIPGQQ